ncbi:substrate-binding domain-containing protein [Rhizobium sp. CFBP 8762]|uniref:substrate-binding domain-containing protein n=1 Tax=Rhizobium sp. CFBP 8762 TaxID=2775279 RepID=UPI00177BDD81|nr:substrate-binding domain-containing protein [Rhizobium sp. CFBP 8762]MBD8555182.1 substrate-binding domain-containing protein [Rhizobium sp. CFBP 8762]
MSSVTINTRTGTGETATLKAYSSFEPYELTDYLDAMANVLPGIAILVERMPTSVLTDRLIQERDHPVADLILGWSDTASKTKGLASIVSNRLGRGDGYVRPTGFSTAFVLDAKVLSSIGKDVSTWEDLADPSLKNRVYFPNPAISGAGFLALNTILQAYGDQESTWSLLRSICNNVAEFPGSAWRAAEAVGDGQVAVGVTVKIAVTKRLSQMNSLQLLEPCDVVGCESEVYGELSNSKQAVAVSHVLRWLESQSAMDLFLKHNKTVLAEAADNLFMIDAARAASERDRNVLRFQSMMKA